MYIHTTTYLLWFSVVQSGFRVVQCGSKWFSAVQFPGRIDVVAGIYPDPQTFRSGCST